MRRFLTLAAVAAVLLPTCAAAQASPVSLTLGVGGAWAGTTCTGCMATHENGSSGLAQLAVYVLPNLRIGVELSGWRREQFGDASRMDYTMAVADYYPVSGAPFYLKGSAGHGDMRFRMFDPYGGAPFVAEQGGFAYGLGAGYDVPLSRRLTLAPFAQILTTRPAEGRLGPFSVEQQSLGMIQYGISLRLR